ncbi:MAG: aspartate-semialdehyde dehydrogenase [Bacteroidia bacterium]
MKLAVVGATGLVGNEILTVLEEINFPVTELLLVASERSVGKLISFRGKEHAVVSMQTAIEARPDIAIFSAGGSTSKAFAPQFAAVGTTVIDNSSAWRMDKDVPLVVPDINLNTIGNSKIIANPNCSTIQMVMVLAPLHKKYRIKRMVVTTFQSVSGTGKAAVDQLLAERAKTEVTAVYAHPIDLNCIPQCDVFLENDYTREEMKVVNETRKILGDEGIQITATCVRVPVLRGHSEAVNLEFSQDFDLEELKNILKNTPNLVLMEDNLNAGYPTPQQCAGTNEVLVGRIRRDESQANSLNLWIVADNLRIGAATNAVRIAERLCQTTVHV